MSALAAKADALRALHRPGDPVVLPNAWDAASARVLADAGFAAIATTSGGVAASLGHPDGEVIPVTEMLEAVGRIARAVDVPVTADLESGYGLAPEDLVDVLLETGAVGMNHEDTVHPSGALRDAGRQADGIAAIKDAARRAGVDIVLNARIDTYLRGGDPTEQLEEAVHRGLLYRDAGADCLFPIMCAEEAAISAIVKGTGSAVNIYTRKGAPDIARLAELGVARITFGGGLMRSTYASLGSLAAALRQGRLPWV